MEDLYRSQFRLPYPLYEQLKTAAEQSGRSINAELVFRLTQSLSTSDTRQSVPQAKLGNFEVEELAEKLACPENRAELKAILAAVSQVSRKSRSGK